MLPLYTTCINVTYFASGFGHFMELIRFYIRELQRHVVARGKKKADRLEKQKLFKHDLRNGERKEAGEEETRVSRLSALGWMV